MTVESIVSEDSIRYIIKNGDGKVEVPFYDYNAGGYTEKDIYLEFTDLTLNQVLRQLSNKTTPSTTELEQFESTELDWYLDNFKGVKVKYGSNPKDILYLSDIDYSSATNLYIKTKSDKDFFNISDLFKSVDFKNVPKEEFGSDWWFEGTVFNDIITASNGDDKIKGLAGNDTINGGNGNDTLEGGVGNDVIYGGKGDDIISGDAGNDKLYGVAGNNTFLFYLENPDSSFDINEYEAKFDEEAKKEYFNKHHSQSAGNDTIYSGNGNDTIQITSKVDNNNLSKDDVSITTSGSDLIIKFGKDEFAASITIKDYLKLGDRHSVKNIQFGNSDTVSLDDFVGEIGITYDDSDIKKGVVNGTVLSEDFDLSNANQGVTINASDGDNTIVGSSYNDKITCGCDDDVITAGAGNDVITGGKGHNTINFTVGDGNDTINLTKGEQLDLVITNENGQELDLGDLKYDYVNNGRDLRIIITEDIRSEEDFEIIDSIIIKNFGSSDGTNNATKKTPSTGFVKVNGNELKDLLLDIDILDDKFNGSWLNERIDASGMELEKRVRDGKTWTYVEKETTDAGMRINGNNGNDEIIGSTAVRAKKEEETLEKMQTAVTEFKSNLLSMYKAHLELITSLPEADSDDAEEEESAPAPVHEAAPAAEDMEATRVIDTASMQ